VLTLKTGRRGRKRDFKLVLEILNQVIYFLHKLENFLAQSERERLPMPELHSLALLSRINRGAINIYTSTRLILIGFSGLQDAEYFDAEKGR
jgi:hypothetical protein